MNILVFGKNGQVAQCLADQLKNYSNVQSTFLSRFDFTVDDDAIHTLIQKYNPNVIVNCAAYTGVEEAEDNADEAYKINALLPSLLAKYAKKNDIPLIHLSTDYVFDGTKEEPYTEMDIKTPLSVYGKTKSEGEDLILKETQKVWILRTSWVYSEYGKNFLKTMVTLLKTKEELTVISDQWGAPTAASQLAKIIIEIILSGAQYPFGVHHVTAFGQTTWFDFAVRIQELMLLHNLSTTTTLKKIETKDYLTKAKRPLNSRLCSQIFNLDPWQDTLKIVFDRLIKLEDLK